MDIFHSVSNFVSCSDCGCASVLTTSVISLVRLQNVDLKSKWTFQKWLRFLRNYGETVLYQMTLQNTLIDFIHELSRS